MNKRQKKKALKKFEVRMWSDPSSVLPESFRNEIVRYRALTFEDIENAFNSATKASLLYGKAEVLIEIRN